MVEVFVGLVGGRVGGDRGLGVVEIMIKKGIGGNEGFALEKIVGEK